MKQLLSPRELAAAIGASESSLKRWIDSGRLTATRTAGGHRRVTAAEAIRFIRESGSALVRPECIGLPELGAVAGRARGAGNDTESLFEMLRDGRSAEARGLMVALYLAGLAVSEVFDGPVRESMRRLGELWIHSEAGVFVEHRATDICLQGVNQLRAMFEPAEGAPTAVGGAAPGEQHMLASLMAATTLAAAGYRAVNLGADSPLAALLSAAETHRPRLVWLSATTPPEPPPSPDDVGAFAQTVRDAGATLVIGGEARASLLTHAPGATGCASMAELARAAAALR